MAILPYQQRGQQIVFVFMKKIPGGSWTLAPSGFVFEKKSSSEENLAKSFVQRKAELAPVLKTSAMFPPSPVPNQFLSQTCSIRGEELVQH